MPAEALTLLLQQAGSHSSIKICMQLCQQPSVASAPLLTRQGKFVDWRTQILISLTRARLRGHFERHILIPLHLRGFEHVTDPIVMSIYAA